MAASRVSYLPSILKSARLKIFVPASGQISEQFKRLLAAVAFSKAASQLRKGNIALRYLQLARFGAGYFASIPEEVDTLIRIDRIKSITHTVFVDFYLFFTQLFINAVASRQFFYRRLEGGARGFLRSARRAVKTR